MGMRMVSTAELSGKAVITFIQTVNNKKTRSNFNHSIHMDWNRTVLIVQEEKNNKNYSNR